MKFQLGDCCCDKISNCNQFLNCVSGTAGFKDAYITFYSVENRLCTGEYAITSCDNAFNTSSLLTDTTWSNGTISGGTVRRCRFKQEFPDSFIGSVYPCSGTPGLINSLIEFQAVLRTQNPSFNFIDFRLDIYQLSVPEGQTFYSTFEVGGQAGIDLLNNFCNGATISMELDPDVIGSGICDFTSSTASIQLVV